jgi:RNA polymerase sigma-70 factor (ECF subfamily)
VHPVDLALVQRMRAGEEAAFEEFFAASFDGLYRFALARLDHDHDLAKEMAQAALCRAFEKLATYRGEAPLFSWLCAICRFEISAHFRRLRREPPCVDLPEEMAEALGALDSLSFELTDPESQALRREVGRLVHLTVDRLPPQYAQVLEWRYTEQLGVPEIARRLAVSYKAAESLLSRARQAFRDGLAGLVAGGRSQPSPAGGEP